VSVGRGGTSIPAPGSTLAGVNSVEGELVSIFGVTVGGEATSVEADRSTSAGVITLRSCSAWWGAFTTVAIERVPSVTASDLLTVAAAAWVTERVTAGGDGGGDDPGGASNIFTIGICVMVVDKTSGRGTEQVGTPGAGELNKVLNLRLTVGGLAPASLLPMTYPLDGPPGFRTKKWSMLCRKLFSTGVFVSSPPSAKYLLKAIQR
jgi:hypothetical protein